jgi:hypothetical protein
LSPHSITQIMMILARKSCVREDRKSKDSFHGIPEIADRSTRTNEWCRAKETCNESKRELSAYIRSKTARHHEDHEQPHSHDVNRISAKGLRECSGKYGAASEADEIQSYDS